MTLSELVKIKDTIASLAQIDSGNCMLTLLQGPVNAFFDEHNYSDKVALENHIQNSLGEIAQSYG